MSRQSQSPLHLVDESLEQGVPKAAWQTGYIGITGELV